MRAALLALVPSEDPVVAEHVALAAAKAARHDFPQEWPDVFETVMGGLQSSVGSPAEPRYLLCLNHLLKELASKRLASDKQCFRAVAAGLLQPVLAMWRDAHATVCTTSIGAAVAEAGLGRAVLLTKCLRRLLVYGFESDSRTLEILPLDPEVFATMLHFVGALGQCGAAATPGPAEKQARRAQQKLLKLLVDLVRTHPWSVGQGAVLGPLLEALCGVVERPAQGATEQLLVQALTALHAVLRCREYRDEPVPSQGGAGGDATFGYRQQLYAAVRGVFAGHFTPARLQQLESAVLRHLQLSQDEIESWESDPEQFFHDQEMSGCVCDNVRSCAEALHCALLSAFPEELCGFVMSLFHQACAECPAVAAEAASGLDGRLLAKEALYNAIALAENDLHELLDVEALLREHVGPELQGRSAPSRVLRRRGLLLLGNWVGKVPGDSRLILYTILGDLLRDTDATVRLSTCSCMRALVDDWNFDESIFEPAMRPALEALVVFLKVAEHHETQLQIFSLICLIVQRMGTRIGPCFDGLLSVLPAIWDDNQGHTLLRVQVVVVMHRLVSAVGAASARAHPFLLAMLQYAANPEGPEAPGMFEDAMLLWHAVLRNAPDGSEQLLAFFPYTLKHVQSSTEHLPLVMQIVQSHIFLSGQAFLQRYREDFASLMLHALSSVNEKGFAVVVPVIELALQADARLAAGILDQTLKYALKLLLDENDAGYLAQVALVNVFSRWCVQDSAGLFEVLHRWGAGGGNVDLVAALFAALVQRATGLSSLSKQKMLALALCKALESCHPSVISQADTMLQAIHTVWASGEKRLDESLKREPDVSEPLDYLVDYDLDAGGLGASESMESKRQSALWKVDPVNFTSISAAARHCQRVVVTSSGGVAAAFVNLQPQTLASLREMAA